MKKRTETKKSPKPTPAKVTGAELPMKTAKGSGKSVALAVAEFDAREIGAAILADPLLMDCFRLRREESSESSLAEFVAWQVKRGVFHLSDFGLPLLLWDNEKKDFYASPRLEAYRLRRIKADKEPVLVGEGWDEAFAALIVDVVKDRVRKAERCPAAGA